MMSSRKKAQGAFASAVLLLFLSGLAGYFTIARLLENERWVIHTYEVRTALGDIDQTLLRAGRARTGYMISQTDDFLAQFDNAASDLPGKVQHLRDLTNDNPKQRELVSQLESAIAKRFVLLRQSIQMKKDVPQDTVQTDLQRESLVILAGITSVTDEMRREEERLLDIREKAARRLFILAVAVLAVSFILALELLSVHYRLLTDELTAREAAEKSALDSEVSLRRLTGRLLRLQDAERRKFSRELHDSLGQYLVGMKMNLEMFATQRKDSFLAEATQLLDQSIAETRTISHLLHPPLLDEAGLSSAAKWYLEGFAQRSGIHVNIDFPEDVSTLPKPAALGLFRVLQESLTNIHRHSNSAKADIKLEIVSDRAILQVRDYGKGIAPQLLTKFSENGTSSGVGLAGMRERIRELGGQLSIQPATPGTLILVTLPLSKSREDDAVPVQLGK